MRVRITEDIATILRDNNTRALLSGLTGVNYVTLSRWVAQRHENLTLYKVLLGISQLTGKPINEFIRIIK